MHNSYSAGIIQKAVLAPHLGRGVLGALKASSEDGAVSVGSCPCHQMSAPRCHSV